MHNSTICLLFSRPNVPPSPSPPLWRKSVHQHRPGAMDQKAPEAKSLSPALKHHKTRQQAAANFDRRRHTRSVSLSLSLTPSQDGFPLQLAQSVNQSSLPSIQ
ncbi:hypothetical protein Mapa_017697 [Marchantia paleacea]|nr:hypothetical protein Mapa_017697 [Marchantia paleacea]